MKETIQKISKKIDAKDFSFSRLEKDYILYYPELKNKLVKVFNKEVIKWNQDFFNFFTEEFVDELDEKLNDFAIYNVLNGKVQFSDAINALSNYDYYQNYFKDPNVFQPLKETIYRELPKTDRKIVSKEVLISLFNEGKYELISEIKGKVQLYKTPLITSLLHGILEKYPFEKYGFPHVLDNHVEDFFDKAEFMDAKSLSLLIKYINDAGASVSISNKNKIYKVLGFLAEKKIYEKNFLDNFSSDDINIISVLSSALQKKFLNYLKKNNYYYLESDFNFETITKIIENIKTDDNTYKSVRYLFLENKMASLANYDEILDAFLDKDDVLPVLSIKMSDSERKNKYTNKIIAKLGSEKVITQLNENIILLENNIDLFKACLDNNVLKEIPIWEGLFKDNPQIEDDIYKALLNHSANLYLTTNFLTIEESNILFELSYKSKNFNSLGQFFEKVEHNKYEKEIIGLTKTNTDFASYLIHHAFDVMSLSNELLEKITISLINRDDIYSSWVLFNIKNNDLFDPVLNENVYECIKLFVSKSNEISIENLDYLTSRLGYKVLKSMDSDNIKEMLSSKFSLEKIKKILDLIIVDDYTLNDAEGLFDSINQFKMSIYNPEVLNITALVLSSIEEGTNDYKEYLEELSSCIDEKLIKFLDEKYVIPSELKTSSTLFLKFIINKIKINKNNPVKKEKYESILREIGNYYIKTKREHYRQNHNMYDETFVTYEINEKSLIVFLVDLLIKKEILFPYRHEKVFLTDILFENKTNEEISIIDDVFNYLNNNDYPLQNSEEIVKKNIRKVKNEVKDIVIETLPRLKRTPIIHEAIQRAIIEGKLNKMYYIKNKNEEKNIALLSSLRLDIIDDKLLSNKEIYSSLRNIMHQKKLHYIPDFLKDYINSENLGFDYDLDSVVAFINYYYEIYKTLNFRENSIPSVPTILRSTSAFSGIRSEYIQILTKENARLIASNPPPIASTKKTKNNERIKESIYWTKNNFERKEVTIPTFNQVIDVNGKKMRCVVGNFTHPSNLTFGERTGSCLRIGGVGESLYYFALNNKNGFHIRLEDLEGNFISRVTGFRNKNAVYLNQIRSSYNEFFGDEDVIDAYRIIGQMIIDKSKNSFCPIDNIVAEKEHDVLDLLGPKQYLGVESIKEGLDYFYSDVSNYAYILATSNENNSLVPIDKSITDTPVYKPAREKIITTDKSLEKYIEMINRVHAVKIYLETNSIDLIEPLNTDGILYGMAGEDWYVFIDEKLNIHKNIIDGDDRAQIEYNAALNYIKKEFDLNKEKKNAKTR